MGNFWWCAILFRIVLPCIIATAGFMRPTITSYIYMIMGCYMPFFSVPTSVNMARSTGTYMKILIVVCLLTTAFVTVSYFVIFFPDREVPIKHCSTLETALRTAGVIGFENLSLEDTFPWIMPEPLMLITSLLLYVIFKRLCLVTAVMRAATEMDEKEAVKEINRIKILSMMLNFGKYVLMLLFCVTAVLKASAIGAIYFLSFLSIATYWSFNRSLGKVFGRVLVFLIPVIFLNLTIIFGYQLQYFHDSKDVGSLSARLLNLVNIRSYKDCEDPRLFKYHAQDKTTYAVPICLYLLYYLTVLIARQVLQAKDGIKNLIVAFFERDDSADPQIKFRRIFQKIKQGVSKPAQPTSELMMADKIKIYLEQILQYIMGISYLAANFVMMIWSIAFVNWKTLPLLVWANLIYLLPYKKRVMLAISPFLMIWVWFILVVGYLYSIDLTEDELPRRVDFVNFQAGIDQDDDLKWINLLTKSLFSVVIFVSLRHIWQERALIRQQRVLTEAVGLADIQTLKDEETEKSKFLEHFQAIAIHLMSICWVWVVIIMMIWMEFWSTSNLLRIAFVGLAIFFVLTFQLCPFVIWKKCHGIYWWIVIVYAMINLFIVYLYQLDLTRDLIVQYVASKEQFEKFGFSVLTDSKELFLALANPIMFQIAVVIQQNYLKDGFNKLTSPSTFEELQREEKELAESSPVWRKLKTTYLDTKNIVFRILEVHLKNLVLLVGWYMCIVYPCALFVPFVLLFTVSCLFVGHVVHNTIIYFVSCSVQILILARLIYMNQYMNHNDWDYVGHYTRNGKPFNHTLNTARWIGFRPSRLGKNYADFWQLVWCFVYVFVVTLVRVVTIRMQNFRQARNITTEHNEVIFPEINFENCHDSIGSMLKFLANYGFYKFGVELTCVFATIEMALRMDAAAILLAFWLLLVFALNRKWMRIIWLPSLVLVAFAIPLEYVATLGLWPKYWEYSGSKFWSSNDILLTVQQFFHLPNMAHPPIKRKITLDFWFLLLMSRQWRCFEMERRMRNRYYPGGSNDDVSYLWNSRKVENPVPDYITSTRNYLDFFKKIIFLSWFYVALICPFFASTQRSTLYSSGYLMIGFVYVWDGTNLFLRPRNSVIKRWNLFIAFDIMIMIIRTVSQIFGCILRYENHMRVGCFIKRTFSIDCVDNFNMIAGVPNMSKIVTCEVNSEALGLNYDCLCFFFLIFQQRIFKSYHFFHILNNAKAQTILGSRGAEFIEYRRHKKRQALDTEDAKIRDNIKRKMDKIRATHLRVQGDVFRRRKDHRKVLKSSDYYLFGDADIANDIPLMPDTKEEEDTDEYYPYDPMPIIEYFGLLHRSNIAAVLEERDLRQRQRKAVLRGEKPEDVRKKITVTNVKPGTSKDPDVVIQPANKSSIFNFILFLWGAFEGCIVSITQLLNRMTRNFRVVWTAMNEERKTLIEKTNYTQGLRVGYYQIWVPAQSFSDVLNASKGTGKYSDLESIQYSIYVKLLTAIGYLIVSHTEWLCHFIIIYNQVERSNFISLPLVVMTFGWGALTVPKPSKTYWVTIIAYILNVMIIKTYFAMNALPWIAPEHKDEFSNRYFPPNLIGMENPNNILLNIYMLIVIFFHRETLQMLGQWKNVDHSNTSLIQDGDYILADGKLTLLTKDNASKSPQVLVVTSIDLSLGDYFPKSIMHGMAKYAEIMRLFIQELISPTSTQIPVDVYTPMFMCDLVNIFMVMFFYGQFVLEEESGFIEFIEDNRVPPSFIIVVLLYFMLIVVDRAIYLKKNRFGKLVYHIFQVIGFHFWLFILYPMVTKKDFNQNSYVKTFYVSKCLYFLFSAYQIRNGYPPLISCHYLWHGTGIVNRFGYKFYREIPYFFEMRTLLDWICSDSCLGVNDWFKMEEITQNIFDQKCEQAIEERWAEPSGTSKNRTKKYIFGSFLYILLILTVIFPILIFSLGSTVGVQTHPTKISIELYMGSAEPIFQSFSSEKKVKILNQRDYSALTSTFNNIEESETIFGNFDPEDVVAIRWSPHSLTKWKISPDTFADVMKEVTSSEPFNFRLEIHYTHIGHGGDKQQRIFGQGIDIPPLPNKNRQTLIDMLSATKATDKVVWLPLVFPKFLLITKESIPKALAIMESSSHMAEYEHAESSDPLHHDDTTATDSRLLRNLLVSLQQNDQGEMWWTVREECTVDDNNYFYYLKDLVYNSCDILVMYTFNEKVFSDAMHFITQSGILGLYLLYFMMVIGIIRGCRIDIGEIWIEDLPNSDYMMDKCMEVYIARDMQNYELEEELFAELVFIMRSREILIKLTRFKDTAYNPPILTPSSK